MVEQTMTNLILRGWDEAGGGDVVRAIGRKAVLGEFDGARDLVRSLNFNSVEEQLGPLETTSAAGILLGESFFAGGQLGPKGRGERDLRIDLVMTATQALAQSLQFNGTRLLQEDVLAKIEAVERATAPEPVRTVFKAADLALADELTGAVARGAESMVEARASLTTSRLVTFGALDMADSLGVSRFQITEILDILTCPVCIRMHGRIFSVGPALEGVTSDLLTQDPTQLASSAPFPKQSKAGISQLEGMSGDQLAEVGWNRPPFHPACRGTVVPVGTVATGAARGLGGFGLGLGLGLGLGSDGNR